MVSRAYTPINHDTHHLAGSDKPRDIIQEAALLALSDSNVVVHVIPREHGARLGECTLSRLGLVLTVLNDGIRSDGARLGVTLALVLVQTRDVGVLLEDELRNTSGDVTGALGGGQEPTNEKHPESDNDTATSDSISEIFKQLEDETYKLRQRLLYEYP